MQFPSERLKRATGARTTRMIKVRCTAVDLTIRRCPRMIRTRTRLNPVIIRDTRRRTATTQATTMSVSHSTTSPLIDPVPQQYSNNGYGNDQYNYSANGYGQTGTYGAYDHQGYGNDAYGTASAYQDQSQYQQRAPSRNMLSRNEQRPQDSGGQGNGAGRYSRGGHAL